MRNAIGFGGGSLLRLAASTAFVLCACSNAWAVLLAYEGFNYAPGTLLVSGGVGVDGGTGWAGTWDETQGVNVDTAVQATSLAYMDGLGNSLMTTGGKLLNTGSETTDSAPGRNIARRTSPAEGATVSTWISFLGERIGDKDNGGTFINTYRNGANLALFDLGTGAQISEKLNLGESSNVQFPGPGGNEDRWMSRFVGLPTGFVVPQPPLSTQSDRCDHRRADSGCAQRSEIRGPSLLCDANRSRGRRPQWLHGHHESRPERRQ